MQRLTEIKITFGNKSEAAAAYPIVEDLIRFYYAFMDGLFDDAKEDFRNDPYMLYLLKWENMKDHDDSLLQNECSDGALRNLKTGFRDIILDCGSELQSTVPDLQLQSREGFFNCLCFVLAWKYPLVPFKAECRCEATEDGPAQETRAVYDAKTIHFEQCHGTQGSDDGDHTMTSDWIISPKCFFYEEGDPSNDPDEEDEDDDEDEEDEEYDEDDEEEDDADSDGDNKDE